MVNIMAAAYILDISKPKMCSWLTVENWEEIVEQVRILSHMDQVLVKYLELFNKIPTVEHLRDVISIITFLPRDIKCDLIVNFDAELSQVLICTKLILWGTETDFLYRWHLEDWFIAHVWTTIINKCIFSTLKNDLQRK